uniref:Uncharacterized protein n=1 Tax=Plectus sambesii TaxID=2011161 RepID=A0A914XKG3_9BILA
MRILQFTCKPRDLIKISRMIVRRAHSSYVIQFPRKHTHDRIKTELGIEDDQEEETTSVGGRLRQAESKRAREREEEELDDGAGRISGRLVEAECRSWRVFAVWRLS